MQARSAAGVVGRDTELGLLRSAFADAVGGRGRLVLISGEAGIGKTTLAASLAAEAERQGVPVANARAPEIAGAPAYWLWTQVLRDCLGRTRDASDSRLPAARRHVLARIVPELRGASRHRAGAEPLIDDAERFRLADEVASFLLERCRVIILDDLHAADAQSLDVLAHLASRLSAGPLLVVGTYRDPADASSRAFQRFLSIVAREESTDAISLLGLDVVAIQHLLRAVTGRDLAREVAVRVHMRTGGNPFFAVEVARLLTQDESPRALPPKVRDVIAWRLDALPEVTAQALAHAALIGREAPIDTLAVACGTSVDAALAALEPAVDAALLRRGTAEGTVQFIHDLVAEVVVARLPLARAAVMHESVAKAIEATQVATRDEWLPRLAVHWAAARPNERSALRTLEVARLAAEQAESRLAFHDAVPLWRTALAAAARAGSGAAQRAELQLGLGRSLYRAGELEEAVAVCGRASLDAEAASRSDLGAAAALVVEGVSEPESATALVGMAERALSRLQGDDLAVRARLHAQIGQLIHLTPAGGLERERYEVARAVELAESSGDEHALEAALRAQQLVLSGPMDVELRLRNAARMVQIARECDDAWPELWGRLWSFDALVQLGRLAEAEVEVRELQPLVDRLRWPVARWHALRAEAALLQARGRFRKAVEAADLALAQIAGGGLGRPEGMHTTFLEAQADLVGELPGDEERLSLLRDLVVREPHVAIRGVISLLRRGLLDEARALYARLPAPDAWRPPQYVVTVQFAERIKAAIALQVADDVEQLLPRLEPLAKWQVAFGSGVHLTLGSGFLYTGMAAACLGELERAIADVSKAIEENARAGAVPLAVVARQELAEILERRGSGADLARARRIASEVMRDAEALGMRPALERSAALLRRIPRQMVRSEELSPRELEVAGLIRHGLTNRQVAMRLGISERTAENHVDHILRKLGFATRAQVAAWVVASERG